MLCEHGATRDSEQVTEETVKEQKEVCSCIIQFTQAAQSMGTER